MSSDRIAQISLAKGPVFELGGQLFGAEQDAIAYKLGLHADAWAAASDLADPHHYYDSYEHAEAERRAVRAHLRSVFEALDVVIRGEDAISHGFYTAIGACDFDAAFALLMRARGMTAPALSFLREGVSDA